MKKLLSLFVFLICLLPVSAQVLNSLPWNAVAEMYVDAMDNPAKSIEQEIASTGLDAKVTTRYNDSPRQLILDVRFQESAWNLIDNNLMQEFKKSILDGYRQAYKTDGDVVSFINYMKDKGACFLIAITTLKNGKVLSKEVSITPQEVIN